MRRRLYQPLDVEKQEVRLLRVKPGARLCYSLECFELGQAPAYHALSYTWGPKNPGGNILINERPFRVRANLLQFLKNLSEEKVPRRLRISKRQGPLHMHVGRSDLHQPV